MKETLLLLVYTFLYYMFYNPRLIRSSDPLRVEYPNASDSIAHDETVFVKAEIKMVEILFAIPGAMRVKRVERVVINNVFSRLTP